MADKTTDKLSKSDFSILFVDDEREILSIVEQYLAGHGYQITVSDNGTRAIKLAREKVFDIIFTDLKMPDIGGLDLLRSVKASSPETEVIILTGFGTVDSAVKALKLGSYDYLQKPIEFERLKVLIDRIIEKQTLQKENILIKRRLKDHYQYNGLVGASEKIREIYTIIDRISQTSPTVFIQGESGTGKELAANVIHQNSDRRDKPFIAVNCGAIVGNLLESELFGHLKGSFTGAIRDNVGLFKAADGGTIFLDEIAEIEVSLQVKLLRALQERKIRPVGAAHEKSIDVRVIAATNQDTDDLLRKNIMREDLYYRLNVINIRMPALREMRADIPLLVRHFLNRFNSRSPKKVEGISPEALDCLDRFHWPGNVRQLENVIERAFALGVDKIIQADDLPQEIKLTAVQKTTAHEICTLRENEIALIKMALKKSAGNRAQAAGLLGINTSTIYRKIEKYHIT
ncbi:MAG: sigma-54-dependent Fis family transcriptional regulator [Desulfobacterales bacterium]|nr:sigma-54-dependent Fis family transcriptional regulator [Desulfobacterales bacterium]